MAKNILTIVKITPDHIKKGRPYLDSEFGDPISEAIPGKDVSVTANIITIDGQPWRANGVEFFIDNVRDGWVKEGLIEFNRWPKPALEVRGKPAIVGVARIKTVVRVRTGR